MKNISETDDEQLEAYIKSEQFKLDMEKSINAATWDIGLPKIIGENGCVVEWWPDGTKNIIKKYESKNKKL